METIFAFDVDGTLTNPRQPIDRDFARFMGRFTSEHKTVLVSGSDLPKLQQQLPDHLMWNCERVYTCSGAECWSNGELVYRKEHEFCNSIVECCKTFVDLSDYPSRFGNHIERRPGMLNVSVVGRNATNEQRQKYFEWDKSEHERAAFVDRINDADGAYEASAVH